MRHLEIAVTREVETEHEVKLGNSLALDAESRGSPEELRVYLEDGKSASGPAGRPL